MKNSLMLIICMSIYFLITSCAGSNKAITVSGSSTQDEHTSRNSVDWNGTYHGILPCADCKGMDTKITLQTNTTFRLSQKYLGKENKPIITTGSFKWSHDGKSIILNLGNKTQMLQVGENRLFWLDPKGKRYTGNFEPHFTLQKVSSTDIENKY